jgi:hypothetical protein
VRRTALPSADRLELGRDVARRGLPAPRLFSHASNGAPFINLNVMVHLRPAPVVARVMSGTVALQPVDRARAALPRRSVDNVHVVLLRALRTAVAAVSMTLSVAGAGVGGRPKSQPPSPRQVVAGRGTCPLPLIGCCSDGRTGICHVSV